VCNIIKFHFIIRIVLLTSEISSLLFQIPLSLSLYMNYVIRRIDLCNLTNYSSPRIQPDHSSPVHENGSLTLLQIRDDDDDYTCASKDHGHNHNQCRIDRLSCISKGIDVITIFLNVRWKNQFVPYKTKKFLNARNGSCFFFLSLMT